MANPAITDVLADAAEHLGDPNQEQFTNDVLMKAFATAFRDVYDICQRWRLPMGKREAFAVIPAYTNVLIPSQAGITDMGEPIALWERGVASSATITGVSNATPMVVTATGNTFTTNSEVDIAGVVGPVGVNDSWFITTVTPGTSFSLNGSVAGGAYISGGIAIQSNEEWDMMNPTDSLTDSVIDKLAQWRWRNDRFYFPGSTQTREVRIEYTSSGAAPTSGNVGIDNFRSFGAWRIASIVAPSYDMAATGQRCLLEAFGPSLTNDGTGGALRGLVGPMLLEKQNMTKRAGAFRPRRNAVTRTVW